jgi:uncharacterized protein (DUF2126 family)
MAIHVGVHHHTAYRYDRPVAMSPHVLRLRPAPHCRTPILAYSVRIEPDVHFINWQQDPFGNHVARLVFPEKARAFVIDVDVVADMTVINPFDFFLDEDAVEAPFVYADALRRDLAPYLEVAEDGPRLRAWVARVSRERQRTIDFLVALNRQLWRQVEYTIRMEPGVQTCERTLQLARGSCRDSGWLLVQVLRHLGFAARFVSGYLVQLKADVAALDGPAGPAADFTDLHAWAEVFLPGAGWVGLDPTSGLLAGEGHIPLACTPSPASAAPVDGATDECEVTFSFANRVTRLREDPRVTLPYSEHAWQAVLALGHEVDERLRRGDVRLTQGGEPTFVSIDDMDSAQWNTAADGDEKRQVAERLVRRLRERFAAGGVLHYGQGKWYPGEELPRWAKTCYWRSDGVPLWHDVSLLADPEHDARHAPEVAATFAHALVDALGVDRGFLQPAYEDIFHLLWRTGQLPADLDPGELPPGDRAALARVREALEQGVEPPRGYVLPLEWLDHAGAFRTSQWPLRRRRLVLLPGESPIGFRLPLDSLPWRQALADRPPDPFAVQPGLAVSRPTPPPRVRVAADVVIKTALCVEVRNGRLCVFLPPLTAAEGFVALLAAIEAAASASGLPVVIEGYEPPRDARLHKLAVTPDPGVIEVNVHPAGTWEELCRIVGDLYEEARLCRLGTEKFMLDGRHTGTGGGNHVTLGGATPADSPFLRRPSLLASMIAYWQNHPGLSYLFSGLFVGPTSQAPRVDEARDDRLFDLEIALGNLPPDDSGRPWLVDRVLRHLLTDLTGNTHRSEFCIDKLYSPDTPAGRLGLVEFRGFEMPPHARMSLVQMLLLRALVAWFWEHPYRRPLIRWGTALHDRFMLAHYVMRDLDDVVADLQGEGLAFDRAWLGPFLEFRFPRAGTVHIGDIELELRTAIEPWQVLGEEVSSFGTARFVDSSTERLQVKASGLNLTRYVLACNGRRVPLRATGVRGEYVAGVRFQAWQPPSALHPTIPVQSPLVFDVVDTFNGRAIGGCTYHVVHAGGRSYDTLPVNAFEAESRRVARFWPFGHTPGQLPVPVRSRRSERFLPQGSPPGPMAPPPEEPSGDRPHTLDLRWWPRV